MSAHHMRFTVVGATNFAEVEQKAREFVAQYTNWYRVRVDCPALDGAMELAVFTVRRNPDGILWDADVEVTV